jgi:Methyltransferase domain
MAARGLWNHFLTGPLVMRYAITNVISLLRVWPLSSLSAPGGSEDFPASSQNTKEVTMAKGRTIAVYDSQSDEYHEAFQTFLEHTDQKLKAQQRLNNLVDRLSSRRVFIDAGAGNGKVTAWFTERFDRTIAIEPNASLRNELRRDCRAAEVVSERILEADIAPVGDLILCAHVFYYIAPSEWRVNLERLVSWLSSDGVLVLMLQNHDTDCMRMLEHFFGRRFDLCSLARQFQEERGGSYQVRIETVPAQIETSDFASAYVIAEFMLNLLPISHPPERDTLEAYVRAHFERSERAFRFSCDQDFIQISRCA